MNSLVDVIEPPTVTDSTEPSADSIFDPDRYFDQWINQLEAARRQLNNQDTNDTHGSEFFFESLPGSNCELTFEGVLHFDGHSMGKIHSPDGTLVVTKHGVVDADIEVGTALIYGSVTGNITANERVFLGDEARVTGQIQTQLLSVREGALFVGDCSFSAPANPVGLANEVKVNGHHTEKLAHFVVGA